MSITDIMAGRMAPGQTFGLRDVTPAPAGARPRPVASLVWQATRRYGRQFLARLPGLLREGGQGLACLPGRCLPHLQALWAALRQKAARSYEAKSHKAAVRALLRPEAGATLVRLLAYAGAVGMLVFAAAALMPAQPKPGQAEPSPVMEWRQVAKPFAAFSLPLPELAESGHDYAMRRHISGGRQDILTWGDLNGAAPHLMIEIYRPGAERAGFDPAEEEIAARLQGLGATSLKPAGEMETKFGTMALVEFSLSVPMRQCLGFAHAYDDPRLQILGWHCTDAPAAVERKLVACALDRLVLLAAGSEPKVREFFARAELKRNFCGQRSHLLAPTPKLGPSAPPPEPKSAGNSARRAFAKSPTDGLLR